jgi:chemotaxis response regulator CheB
MVIDRSKWMADVSISISDSSKILDDLLLKIKKNPDVIKIDVEGSEMQVLEGLQETLRKGVKCLMIEVHSEENKRLKICSLIITLRFLCLKSSLYLMVLC